MGLTIRQKINRSKLSKDERLLRNAGIVQASVQGEGSVLTDQGRSVLLDLLWEDDAIRKQVIKLVREAKTVAEEDFEDDF